MPNIKDYTILLEQLKQRECVNENWETLEILPSGIYCEDKNENTFISVFDGSENQIKIFMGYIKPHISVDITIHYLSTTSMYNFIDDIIDQITIIGKAKLETKFEIYLRERGLI